MNACQISSARRFVGAVFIVVLALVSTASAEVLVGAARVDVTPAEAIRLTGYASRSTPSTGVAQKLWAKALAIGGDEDGAAVLITLDNCGIAEQTYLEVAARLEKKARLSRERMTIACSHTHAGPCTTHWAPNIFAKDIPPEHQEVIERYTRRLVDQLEEVALAALRARRPGRISWAEGAVDFARNRRTTGGPVDHALPVLKAEDLQGGLIALVANYACHCTTLGGDFNQAHGDWAGFAQAAMERDHPGAVAMITIGCGADANPAPRGTLALAEQHGESIATEVKRLLSLSFAPLTNRLSARQQRIELPFSPQFTRAQWEARSQTNGIVGYHARKNLARLDRGEALPTQLPYYVQTWNFGDDLALVFLNGEVVVDYALQIKKEFDARRVWVSGYSGYVPCYIPSKRILREGGYEAEDSLWYYDRPARLAPESEDLILKAVRALMPLAFRFDPRKAELPDPRTPAEALATLRTHPDLQIELVASEPLIASPVAIDWDARGRLWVCEMVDYPMGIDGNWKPGGRIKILTDTDGDGKFDHATIFLDGLTFPTGVLPWKKGALICAAPNVLYAEDLDGDGRADVVRTNLVGFATHNFQARVNGFSWGLDGWWHGSSGLFGGKVRSMANGQEVDLGGRDFRFRPDTGELEPLAGISQMGRIRDDFDNWFGNDNSTVLWQYPLADEYVRRNPGVHYPEPRVAVVRGEHPNQLYPSSRTLERFNDPQSANQVTSACGPAIYRDQLLGPGYEGNAFTCEPVHNLVRRTILARQGVTFSGRRAPDEQRAEFLSSTDNWFRPVQARTGRDGALWVVDMYRFVIEHPRWISSNRLAQLDVRAGADKGRIYRVYGKGAPLRAVENLEAKDGPALVAALATPNGPTRDLVHQALVGARAEVEAAGLADLARAHAHPGIRAQALSILAQRPRGASAAVQDLVIAASLHGPAEVRRVAIRLCESYLRRPNAAAGVLAAWRTAILPEREGTATEARPMAIDFQLALSLGESKDAGIAPILAVLARSSDRWIRSAVLSSAGMHAVGLLQELSSTPGNDSEQSVFMGELCRTAIGAARPEELERVLNSLLPASFDFAKDVRSLDRVATVLSAYDELPASVRANLEASSVANRLRAATASGRELVRDAAASVAARESAVLLLNRSIDRPSCDSGLLAEVLAQPVTPRQRLSALARIVVQTDPAVARDLLARWPSFGPAVRDGLIGLFLARRSFTTELVAALNSGVVTAAELSPVEQQRLLKNESEKIREAAAGLFSRPSSRAAVVARYQIVTDLTGDPARGAPLFEKNCASCHALRGLGHAVGPNLAEFAGKTVPDFILAILDPSAAINPAYLAYSVETRDGRTLTGLVRDETAAGFRVVQGGGVEETVARSNLRELRASPLSLMPEGLEQTMTAQDLADLIAWIKRSAPPGFGSASAEQTARARADFLHGGAAPRLQFSRFAETIPYPSWLGRLPLPHCRQTAGANVLAWQGTPSADIGREGMARFRWPGAMGLLSAPSGHFELRINGQAALEFNVTLADAQWQSADGSARLVYTVMEANAEDSNGVFVLELGARWLAPGKPAQFEVIGSDSGSQRWFGIYQLEDKG